MVPEAEANARPEDGLPMVMDHADEFEQVFLNMILNNQNAMPKGPC